jgi:hypothetical protein
VHQAGPCHPAHEPQGIAELAHVVPVDGAEVPEAELLEEHPVGKEVLGAFLQVLGELNDAVAKDTAEREGHVLHLLTQRVGPRVGHDAAEHPGHSAHIGRNGHPVVVQDDDDVAFGVTGVVEPLVGEPAGERAVPYDGDHLVGAPAEVTRGRHTERGRDRGAGVPGAELVVLALRALEKPGDAAGLPKRREVGVPTGEELPGIRLVPDIPDDPIGGGVELVEQRDAQLYHPEAGTDVPAGNGAAVDEARADLVGQLRELLPLEALEVRGGVHGVE